MMVTSGVLNPVIGGLGSAMNVTRNGTEQGRRLAIWLQIGPYRARCLNRISDRNVAGVSGSTIAWLT